MQVDRKVLEQALESMESVNYANYSWACVESITALKAALEQSEQKSATDEQIENAILGIWQDVGDQRLPGIAHPPRREWQSLTDEERDYFKACGFVGVSRVEEVLRAKNSTLACIPAVPPGLEDIEEKKGL